MSMNPQKNLPVASPAFFLSFFVLFSVAVSLFVWMGQSLRLDEAQSVWQTSRDFLGVADVIAKDVHMPFYFLGLHFWVVLFGTTEIALRVFSLVFFALSIPAIYSLAKEAYTPRVAFWSALLVAVSPFLNWYGSEARMYSLLFLLTTLSHLLFIRLWKRPSLAVWVGYAVVSVLGLFTHIFFGLILIVQAGFYAAHRKLFAKEAAKSFSRTAVLVGLLGLGWFVYRLMVGAGLSDPMLSRPTSVDFFNVFSNFFIGFQTDGVNTLYLSLWPVLVFLAFTFLAWKRQREPQTTYLALASFLPIIVAFIVSILYQPAFLSRYLIVCLPSIYLLAVYFLSSYRGRVSVVALSILTFVMASMLVVQAVHPRSPVKEDYRAASQYVEERAKPSDLFVVSAPFITYPVEYYYRGAARLATFPRWNRFANDLQPETYNPTLIERDSAEWAKVYEHVYLLLSYDQGFEDEVRLYMDKNYERVDMKTFSPGLSLYVYKLRYI